VQHAGRVPPDARTTVLRTARARLTTWLPGDLPDLVALHADPVAMRWMQSGPEDEERVRARLATWLREQAEQGGTKWRVEDPAGRMIGRAGFRLSDDGRRRELGYLLAPAQWGRGLATEVARALVHWHREHLDGLEPRLEAVAFAGNLASRRVLEKCGFSPAARGELRGEVLTRYAAG
jgi:[ribosomal protein S5]-alanine N-acetyltransferase